MDTILQMIKRAGRRFSGLGRRQKRQMKKCCDNMPTTPLEVEYTNGVKIKYTPTGVEGQFLVCRAVEKSPILPNEVEHSGIAISMWEFPDIGNRKLFQKYHESLSAKCALMWDDGLPVSSRDLFAEQYQIGPNQPPPQSNEIQDRRSQRPNPS